MNKTNFLSCLVLAKPRALEPSYWLVAAGLLWAGPSGQAQVPLTVGQNFTASTYAVDSAYNPPDCNGAPGPLHYVELINGRYSVFLKSNAAKVQTMTMLAFWNAAGVTVPSGFDVTDPRVVFDPTAQRWFASAIDFDPTQTINTNRFLLAVSASADPTGPWQSVAFPSDTNDIYFADFPTFGLNAQGVFLGGNLFDTAGNEVGSSLVSIPKADLLASPPTAANRTSFFLQGGAYGWVLQPAFDFDASATTEPVLAVGDLGYDFLPHSTLVGSTLSCVTTPNGALLSAPATNNVPSYAVPINPTQPNGDNSLDDGDARIGAKVYEVEGMLYAAHSIQVSNQVANRAAIRWYRLSAADFSLLESGTISDPNLDLFYPSIAANAYGQVVIAFNGCSTSSFISIYAMGGQTVSNVTTFGSRVLLKAGATSYVHLDQNNVSRWGDYSTVSADPANPNSFWVIHMFPSSSGAWSTQVTQLLTPAPALSITQSGNTITVCWPGPAGVWNLQASPTLAPANWMVVSQGLPASGNQVCASLPVAGGAQYFRLLRQ